MELSKLLEYQEFDIQLRRLLDVIERSDDYKRIERSQKEFAQAKKTVEDSEAAAASLVDFFNSGKRYYDETVAKIEELEKAIEAGDETEEVLNLLIKQRNRLIELDTKLSERRKKAETVVKAYVDANNRGRKVKEIHTHAKERQDQLKKDNEPAINELKQKLAKLEPQIDKEIMSKYKSLTSERKYPAFVEAYVDDKTYSCRGCGMALSQKGSSTLDDNGYCICESCRRIIFKK